MKPFIIDEVLQMRFVRWFALYTIFPSIFLPDTFKTGLKNDPSVYERELAFDSKLQWCVMRISERIDFTPNKIKEVSLQKRLL